MDNESTLRPLSLSTLPNSPLVSILIANYNNARFLPEGLNSVLEQTYKNWEAIICDDGSTDNSRQVIEGYLALDSRFRCVFKENGGVSTALNVAYSESKGEIIALLDADDAMLPAKCSRIVETFLANNEAGFVGHRLVPISATSERIGDPLPIHMDDGWLAPKALKRGGHSRLPPGGGLAFRREVTELIFPIPPQFRRGADGYMMGLAQFVTKFRAIDEADALYRLHEANLTGVDNSGLSSLANCLDDHRKIFDAQREFLTHQFGAQTASMLRLENHPPFRSGSLIYLAVTRQIMTGVPEPSDFIVSLSTAKAQMFWRAVLLAPTFVNRSLYALWVRIRLTRFGLFLSHFSNGRA